MGGPPSAFAAAFETLTNRGPALIFVRGRRPLTVNPPTPGAGDFQAPLGPARW